MEERAGASKASTTTNANACDVSMNGGGGGRAASVRSARSSRSSGEKDDSCATRTRFPSFAWRDERDLDDACLALMRGEISLGTERRRRAMRCGYGCCASEKTGEVDGGCGAPGEAGAFRSVNAAEEEEVKT